MCRCSGTLLKICCYMRLILGTSNNAILDKQCLDVHCHTCYWNFTCCYIKRAVGHGIEKVYWLVGNFKPFSVAFEWLFSKHFKHIHVSFDVFHLLSNLVDSLQLSSFILLLFFAQTMPQYGSSVISLFIVV